MENTSNRFNNSEIQNLQVGEILSPDIFEGITIPDVEKLPVLNQEEKSSFKLIHDSNKLKYLADYGIGIPEEWINNPEYHAEIVTTTIIAEHMKDIFRILSYYLQNDPESFVDEKEVTYEAIQDKALRKEILFHESWLIRGRLDIDDFRSPDVISRFSSREARLKSIGIQTNSEGRVSVDELKSLVKLVIDSFRK